MKKKKIQKTNAMRTLENYKINYAVHEYAWNEEHTDAKTAASKVDMPFEQIYKTLVAVGNKTGVIVACIPASAALDLKKLAKVSGNKKVDMLQLKDLEKTTGYIRGGCSPVGMKKLFPAYIADHAETLETVVVSAGKRGLQVEVFPQDLIEVTKGQFADITK